jgi:hypothetical protein
VHIVVPRWPHLLCVGLISCISVQLVLWVIIILSILCMCRTM